MSNKSNAKKRFLLILDPDEEIKLRDKMADAALQGLLSTGDGYYDDNFAGWEWFAKASYAMADEMLKERLKGYKDTYE